MEPIKIGLLGLGTVGAGTFNVLTRNASEIARRAGRDIQVVAACVSDLNKVRECSTDSFTLTTDPYFIINHPDIDIVVEVMGGETQARDLVLAAIANGKHIVTANKAMIAKCGNEIFQAAHEQGVMVAFEAAVAGGIPIIKALREGLSGNRIEWLAGIMNGTCNYILTEMQEKQRDFASVLAEAQALGYAEADPEFDVEGIDVAHKLTILAAIAFGIPLQFSKVFIEGISSITPQDIQYAQKLGYCIKHLGIAKRTNRGIELRAHPTLIPIERTLAHVNGVMNAVLIEADAVGPTLYMGAGAGAEPTASAVVADIVDVVRTLTADPNHRVPHLAFQPEQLENTPILPMEETQTANYLRLMAADKPGVLAHITKILGDLSISIESILQKERDLHDGKIPVVIITQHVLEKNLNQAIQEIEALPDISGHVVRLRLDTLN